MTANPHNRSRTAVVAVIAWIVGAVFLYAGLTKIIALPRLERGEKGISLTAPQDGWLVPAEKFAKAIRNYQLVPPVAARFLAVTLPWVEIAAAVALFMRRYRYAGTLATALMTVMFIGAISWALANGLNIDCGCFSLSSTAQAAARRVGVTTLLMDVAILAGLTCMVVLLEQERKAATNVSK